MEKKRIFERIYNFFSDGYAAENDNVDWRWKTKKSLQ